MVKVNNRKHVRPSSRLFPKRNHLTASNVHTETFYHTVLDSLDDYAVFTFSNKRIITSWNNGASRILGYTQQEIIGKNADIIFTSEDRDKHAPIVEMLQAKQQGKAKDERWHVRKDGTRFWASGLLFPFKQHNEWEYTKILRDLTQQKNIERELKNSEQRFRTLLEHSYDAVVLISDTGKTLYASPSIKHVTGYTPEEYMTIDTSKLIHPDESPYLITLFREIIAGVGKTFPPQQSRFLHKEGQYRWIEFTATNLCNDPTINALVFNFRDITEQKQSEDRQTFLEDASSILSSSLNYETTLKNIGKLIIPFMADYCRIVVVGEKKDINEIVIQHVDSTKLPIVKQLYAAYKDNHRNTHGVSKLIEKGETEFIPYVRLEEYALVDKKLFYIMRELNLQSYIGVPMKVGNKVVGVLTFSSAQYNHHYTIKDVALAEELARRAAIAIENARLFKEAQKEIVERKKLEKQKDEFIGVASHELKTPVTSIKSFGQVLQLKFAREGNIQAAELLGKMDAQINKLTSLIGDLLDVTKIEAGKMQFNEENFSFDELIMEVQEELQRTTPRHQLTVSGQSKKTIYGDRERIGQVIVNLITNAIKYSPYTKEIVITTSVEDNHVKLCVQDFGVGIPKDKQEKVFERFFRVSGPGKETYPGLGLGLYISSEIIKRSQGKIWVESIEGKGSTFCFQLPISQKSNRKK